jgi:hypothetical protein
VALAGVAALALLTAAAIYWGGIPYGDLANAKRDGSLGASQEGWSLGGDYIKFYPSSGPGACRVDCDAIPAACKGFTWVKPGGY